MKGAAIMTLVGPVNHHDWAFAAPARRRLLRPAAGLPLIYVQRQLGHASIITTERQYGHLEKSFLRGAARRAEAAIWEGRLEVPEELAARR